jgi:hypothetical protein
MLYSKKAHTLPAFAPIFPILPSARSSFAQKLGH